MPRGVRAGHPVFWQVFGEGAREGLAIHCSLAHSGAWSGVMRRLGGQSRILAFDLPGHGQSGEVARDGRYAALSCAIGAEFLDGLKGPVDLIGHSFGALVALSLALRAPERVRTLTLVEPVLFAAVAGTPAWEAHRRDHAAYAHALARGDRERAVRVFLDHWGTGARWEAMPALLRETVARQIDLIAAGAPLTDATEGPLLAPGALESLAVPVLLVEGGASPPVIGAIAAALAARIPGARRMAVPGAGHMLPVTHADAVAEAIARLWSERPLPG
jgi:pimeloyl-ACP methyl ester carboxylesterase